MFFSDALTMDAPRRTKDGFLAVRARAARTGVYQYAGFEVDPDNKHGLRDKSVINVLRDEATVFDTEAARSFIGKPVTDDHPAQSVTAENWKDHARGTIMGAMRDGEYLAFDLLLTDAATISKINDGKRELSNGYSSNLEFGTFTAADGTICQARQTSISGNHVALVDRGRAGPECRIKDGFAVCDANPAAIASLSHQEKNVPKITLDGLVVDLSDAAAVEAAITKFRDKATAAEAALADANTALSTEKGKVAALEKQLADAKAANSPEAIDKLVADRAALIGKAKAINAGVVTDGKSDADIRRDVVSASLGDAAKDMNDDAIAGAFALLTKDAKPAAQRTHSIGTPASLVDTASIRDAARRFRNVA